MIAAGRYSAHFVPGSLQFTTAKSGSEQLAVDLQIEGGETVTSFLSFAEKATPYSEERLVALGWAGKGHPLDEAELTREVQIDISYSEWQGKQQMRVDIVTGGGRVKVRPENIMPPAAKSAFLARLTGVDPSKPKIPF